MTDIQVQELLKKEKYLEVINSFATVLIEAQSIEDIVKSVAKNAIARLNYYDCVIYIYDKKQNKLIQSAAYGPKSIDGHAIFEPILLNPGEGIVGTVFATGKGEIVNDTSKDPRYIVDDAARLSEITVPLVHKGKVIGVIDSEHPDANFFNEEDFKMLTTVAAMVSTKIAQAQATLELKKYQFNLEKLVSKKTKELEEINSELTLKNREKELLLKEIHHRVKNNMQVIISLLNIQANASETSREKSIMEEFKNRIRSMALVHDRLYFEEDMANIAIDEYIMELSTTLLDSFHSDFPIEISFDIPDVRLSIDMAIPLGLIINELLTNSMKHAFRDIERGKVHIGAKLTPDTFELHLSDNGKGFVYDKTSTSSFGLELVEILVQQLSGNLEFSGNGGAHYVITCPV